MLFLSHLFIFLNNFNFLLEFYLTKPNLGKKPLCSLTHYLVASGDGSSFTCRLSLHGDVVSSGPCIGHWEVFLFWRNVKHFVSSALLQLQGAQNASVTSQNASSTVLVIATLMDLVNHELGRGQRGLMLSFQHTGGLLRSRWGNDGGAQIDYWLI